MRLVAAIIVLLSLTLAATAERRVALVVGNNDYLHAPKLTNPVNDAGDVATALEQVGFTVTTATDTDLIGLQAAIRKFARSAKGSDVSLFYYSGHGMQWEGENMLVPVDATFKDAEIVPFEVLPLDEVMGALALAGKAKILILDACRDNDAEQSLKIALAEKRGTRSTAVKRGLVKLKKTQGQIVVFATQADRTASDGFGDSSRNSPFTHAFLETINEPGLEVGRTFRKVAAKVNSLTNGAQLPEISISLLGEFYFVPGELTAAPAAQSEPRQDPVAADYRLAEKINTEAAWSAFLAKHGADAGNFHVVLAREAQNKLALAAVPQADGNVAVSGLDKKNLDAALSGSDLVGPTIDLIRARDALSCGVNPGYPGFSYVDDNGDWRGFDIDICRAVAAAVLKDANKVMFVPLTAKQQFTALQSGEVDLLPRGSAGLASRYSGSGVKPTGITYHDGLGMIVRRNLGVSSALEMSGAAICLPTGTTIELDTANYFRQNDLQYEVVAFETTAEIVAAYEAGRCDTYLSAKRDLYAQRLTMATPADHVVLPEIITKETYGPYVRADDVGFESAVGWVVNALVQAEELGLSSANLPEPSNNLDPRIHALVKHDWARSVIARVGNYDEVFRRNVGPDTNLGIDRGVNALWTNGGILTAPSFR